MKEKEVITITVVDGKLDVKCTFIPSSKTTGPMKPSHAAAMAAIKGITAWVKGEE